MYSGGTAAVPGNADSNEFIDGEIDTVKEGIKPQGSPGESPLSIALVPMHFM
jgi:hypothetical protein